MGDHLPWELITLILLRLPSKSLIRFRSVCKSWLSLVSSSQFRLMYLLSSNFSRTLVRRVSGKKNRELYSIHFNDQHLTLDTGISIEYPVNFFRDRKMIIGCCNGVICLSDDMSGRDETILWNPSIRKTLTLIPPTHRNKDSQNLSLVFGFGYDKTTDDYKVIRLAYQRNSITITRPHVEVYSVKTAIWRVVEFPQDLPCFCLLPNCVRVPVFLNGSAHWLVYSTPRSPNASILAFDMSAESFGEIQLPENLACESPSRLGLVVVEESLGVIHYSSPIRKSTTYKIWAMKEYNKANTWTMLYNVNYHDKDVGRALGLTNNGGLITVSNQHDLKIYNQEGCYNVLGSDSQGIDSLCTYVARYKESLALLDVGNDVNHGSCFTLCKFKTSLWLRRLFH